MYSKFVLKSIGNDSLPSIYFLMLAKYVFPSSNFLGSEKNLSRKNFFVVWMLYAIVDDGRSVYLHICTFSKKAGSIKQKREIK